MTEACATAKVRGLLQLVTGRRGPTLLICDFLLVTPTFNPAPPAASLKPVPRSEGAEERL